jgi:hypothetical protein
MSWRRELPGAVIGLALAGTMVIISSRSALGPLPASQWDTSQQVEQQGHR